MEATGPSSTESALSSGGLATVAPKVVVGGATVTLTPTVAIQPICTGPALILLIPSLRLLGALSQDGRWTPSTTGRDLVFPECLPAMSGDPVHFVVPFELKPGRYSLCVTIRSSVDGCGPFEVRS